MKKDIVGVIAFGIVGLISALCCASCESEAIEPMVAPEVAAHDTLKCGVIQLHDIREAVESDSLSYIIANDTLRMERKSVAQAIGALQCTDDVEWDLWYCATCKEYYLACRRRRCAQFMRLGMAYKLSTTSERNS